MVNSINLRSREAETSKTVVKGLEKKNKWTFTSIDRDSIKENNLDIRNKSCFKKARYYKITEFSTGDKCYTVASITPATIQYYHVVKGYNIIVERINNNMGRIISALTIIYYRRKD